MNPSKTLFLLCLLTAPASAGPAIVTQLKGHAERRLPDSSEWIVIDSGDRIPEGSSVITGEKSRLELEFDTGHRLQLTANAFVTLTTLHPIKTKVYVTQGKVRSKVRPLKTQEQYLIQTPSAVCAVRGTEFWTGVTEKGTAVEVFKGAVGLLANGASSEFAIRAGESGGVMRDGTIVPPHVTQQTRAESPLARVARHEVGLDMSRNEVMAAAAAEIRLAEYREGKSLVDVEGRRVRLEEYIMRPQPNQFKFVVLNERNDRLDYFFLHGTFNQTLPTDLSLALRDLSGRFGTTAPDYYLTSYEMGQSNTQDSVHDTATGGHLVQIGIDSNGDYVLTDSADPGNTRTIPAAQLVGPDQYSVYNPLSDSFFTATSAELSDVTRFSMYIPSNQTFQDLAPGDTFWKTRFNSYTHELNNVSKIAYTASGASNILATQLDGNWTIAGGFYLPTLTVDPNNIDATLTYNYGDGTYESYRTTLIDNDGKIAPTSAFAGITTGAAYKNELLKWNYEQQISATEFQGRKIDLVVEPRIFIDSGLIP